MRIDRRLLTNFDWVTLGVVLFLSLLGILTIYSATRPVIAALDHPNFYVKQAYWLVIGIIGLIAIASFDYSWLNKGSFVIYGLGIVMLILVVLIGRTGMGAQRWVTIGPVTFQPSEFLKLAYVIMLARYISSITGSMSINQIVFAFMSIVLFPLILVIKQPDLGTGLILLALFMLLTLAKGVAKKTVIVALIISLIALPFVANIMWDHLKDYQKMRIVAFLHPEMDPEGTTYHINQSKVAIGSGKIIGKGYLQGTQGPFRFLPEKHTDFIFSIFAEEWGFLGTLFLLAVYAFLIIRGLDTAQKAKDEFGRILALGITFMFLLYCFINVGMTLGIMPVVGIPLPFMSYGGTALLSNYIAAGILISIRTRRFELFY